MDSSRRQGARARPALLLTAALLVSSIGACSTNSDPGPKPSSPSASSSAAEQPLTVGVIANSDETAAWKDVIAAYVPPEGPTPKIRLTFWADTEDETHEVDTTTDLPDLFMIDRPQLEGLMAAGKIQPVSDLLDARGVDFGDGYERTTLLELSADNALQCMPWGASPQVIFYNTDLIDFTKMAARGLEVPEEDLESWNFDQFIAAAKFASRPAKGQRGFYIDPTLTGLAPWLYAANGKIFDDEVNPTALAFGSEETNTALDTLLPVLRRQRYTLTAEQLAQDTPLGWFEKGQLGMIVGDRSLVPRLRAEPTLNWDVMPIPSIEQSATTGEGTALCMSADAPAEEAADLLAHLISKESEARIAREGYLVPTSATAIESDDFLQPGRLPANGRVFTRSIRQIEWAFTRNVTPELVSAVQPGIDQLLHATLPDVAEITTQMDTSGALAWTPPAAESEGTPSP